MRVELELEPGTYIVAVSGGVDSISLLQMLVRQAADNELKLVVAHFDHGIRADSKLDRLLVQETAQKYGVPFVYHEGHLGGGTSEAQARQARYAFLRQVQAATQASAIITAHHQDDLIETAIINLLRGTGRKGITALGDHRHLRRPLLQIPKSDIQAYAKDQGLIWREDSTNQDLTLLRNYVRQVVLPRLGAKGRQTLLAHIGHMSVLNRAVDNDIALYLHLQPSRQTLNRLEFVLLPHAVALEVMAQWLRSNGIIGFNRKQLEQLVARSKVLEPGKQIDIDAGHRLLIGRESLVLVNAEVA
jgi:tRNA(Ile)-lysidine synthetase-like protein